MLYCCNNCDNFNITCTPLGMHDNLLSQPCRLVCGDVYLSNNIV